MTGCCYKSTGIADVHDMARYLSYRPSARPACRRAARPDEWVVGREQTGVGCRPASPCRLAPDISGRQVAPPQVSLTEAPSCRRAMPQRRSGLCRDVFPWPPRGIPWHAPPCRCPVASKAGSRKSDRGKGPGSSDRQVLLSHTHAQMAC